MIAMMIFPYPSCFSSIKQRNVSNKKVLTVNRKKMKNIISKQTKQLVENKKKTNQVVMGMIQVYVYYASTILPLRLCYGLIIF